MGKVLTLKKLEDELSGVTEANEVMKAAASMVGFNVDGATDDLVANADQRVRVNLYQRGRITTLKSLIEDLQDGE